MLRENYLFIYLFYFDSSSVVKKIINSPPERKFLDFLIPKKCDYCTIRSAALTCLIAAFSLFLD